VLVGIRDGLSTDLTGIQFLKGTYTLGMVSRSVVENRIGDTKKCAQMQKTWIPLFTHIKKISS